MTTPLEDLKQAFALELADAEGAEALHQLEARYLKKKKGLLANEMRRLPQLPPEERRGFGAQINALKTELTDLLKARHEELTRAAMERELHDPFFDPTLPGTRGLAGTPHPVDVVQRKLERAFRSMGFYVLDYPELESEFYNFEGLNIPADHPARDMQDTFWIDAPGPSPDNGLLLRTHTSSGQIRAMQSIKPPFKAIFPGRVFRMEATDASHEHTFHQVEGLMIDKDISVANLISSMKTLLSSIFERDVQVRLRPGYFPFVEPGFELDIRCLVCGGDGCSVCKHSGWVELLPCGLVHPNVLRHGGLDPNQWSGWAFGLGLSRLVLMKYQVEDIRLLLGGDLRFLGQFTDAH
jgi:phenylalanyl-tRNA synthetase alpha chain